MDDLILILATILSCFMSLAFWVAITYFIIRTVAKRPDQKNIPPNQDKRKTFDYEWLLEQKAKGITHIDDLIALCKQDEDKVIPEQTQTVSNLETYRIQNLHENKIEPRKNNAKFLLYFGSFLVSVAILSLVALNWESMSNGLKTLILIITITGFYLLGYIINRIFQLRDAGHTFYLLASIILGISGIGFWNFGINQISGLTVNLYFFLYAALILLINIGFYLIIRRKRFLYIALVSTYVFFTSTGFLTTNDYKFRIVIIAILNLVFYLTSNYLYQIKKDIGLFSTVTNWVLNVIIYLFWAVLYIPEGLDRFIAVFALLIPTLFILIKYFRENSSTSLAIEALFLQLKAFAIMTIFRLDINASILLFLFINSCFVLLSELLIDKQKINLRDFLLGVATISTLWINTLLFVDLFDLDDKLINPIVTFLSLIVSLLVFLLPWFLRKNKGALSITLVYTIFVAIKLLFLIYPNAEIDLVILMIGFITAVLTAVISYLRLAHDRFTIFLKPSLVSSMALYSVIAFFSSKSHTHIVAYLVITIELILLSYVFSNSLTKILSILTLNIALYQLFSSYSVSLNLILTYLSIVNFMVGLLEWLDSEKTQKLELNYFAYTAKVMLFLCMSAYAVNMLIIELNETHFSPIYFLLAFIAFLFSKNTTFRRMSGISLVFLVWYFVRSGNWNFQFYIIPFTVYLLVISFLDSRDGNKSRSLELETLAYLLQFLSFFLHSLLSDDVNTSLVISIILMMLSAGLTVFGYLRRQKIIWILALVFLNLTLVFRFLFVVTLIPWWIYLACFGLVIILIATNSLIKLTKSQEN